jgi:hypothetical protein
MTGSLQESDRSVRQIGTDANIVHAASSDGRVLSGRNSPGLLMRALGSSSPTTAARLRSADRFQCLLRGQPEATA